MRIGVAGLGAVGGLMAGRFGTAGHDVVALARGATLAAVRERGLLVADVVTRPTVSDDAAELGVVDLLVVGFKAPALAAHAAALAPMIGPGTVVLPAMNGVPWWFLGADAAPLTSIDRHGHQARHLPLAQTLGCVVHFSSSVPEPGVVRPGPGDRLIVGEPAGGLSDRASAVARVLTDAGFAAEVSDDVRREIWFKLWGNMTMNPVSALTLAAADAILDDDLVRGFMVGAMAEAAAVGAAIGCPIDQDGEQRLDLARQLGAFRTSMLQDVEAGRPIEIDALTGVVREIGARVGVPTPSVDALHGLARLMGASRGLYARY